MGKIKETLKKLFKKKDDKMEDGRDAYFVSQHGGDNRDKSFNLRDDVKSMQSHFDEHVSAMEELRNHPAMTRYRESANSFMDEIEKQEERQLQQKRIEEELKRKEEQRRLQQKRIEEELRLEEERLHQNTKLIQGSIEGESHREEDGKKDAKTDRFGYRITKSEEEKSLEETMASSIELNKRTGVGELGESEIDSGDDEYNL